MDKLHLTPFQVIGLWLCKQIYINPNRTKHQIAKSSVKKIASSFQNNIETQSTGTKSIQIKKRTAAAVKTQTTTVQCHG